LVWKPRWVASVSQRLGMIGCLLSWPEVAPFVLTVRKKESVPGPGINSFSHAP
jgi:hypothetical protein